MNMLKYKDVIEEGDLVIVYLSVRNMYPLVLKHGEVFQNKYGALKHSDVIGKKYGSVVNCSRGYVYVLFPTPELWTVTLPHRTQILYFPDISMIIMQLDLKPGSVVCEAGTGSGSLSHAIARTISPNGLLYTFDCHEQRVDIAKKEFQCHGLNSVVKIQHRDVGKDGFSVQNEADAVILDLPQPWEVIPHVPNAIKLEGGRMCSFSPCIEQVQQTCKALQAYGFTDITTIECLQRQFEVRKVTMPAVKGKAVNCTSAGKAQSVESVTMEEDSSAKTNDSVDSSSQDMKSGIRETFWSAVPPLQTQGHSGYLTFCTLYRREKELPKQ